MSDYWNSKWKVQFLPILANVSLNILNITPQYFHKNAWKRFMIYKYLNLFCKQCIQHTLFLILRRYLFVGTILSQICLFRKCCFAFWFNIKFYMCLNHLNVHLLIIKRIIKKLTSVRNKQILKVKYETILINNISLFYESKERVK